MYSTCLFCKRPLGVNESIEVFPVGKRLAFDPERGRLWVVCLKCRRWNLSPLEERWEAVESCEREFRETPRQVSTEHIGIARLKSGLELVRIGRPLRPEFAAWRYGDHLQRRRWHNRVYTGIRGTVQLGLMTPLSPIAWPIAIPWMIRDSLLDRNLLTHGISRTGIVFPIRRRHARKAHLRPDDDAPGGWRLEVKTWSHHIKFSGDEAVRVAGLLLPHVNVQGASARQVEAAVSHIEQAGDVEHYFRRAASTLHNIHRGALRAAEHRIIKAPSELRLALEMISHETIERRALQGELHLLERSWRDAEEIAAIADDLLLPEGVESALERMREAE